MHSVASVSLVSTASAPLYVAGYHNGAYPFIGWVFATIAGAAIAGYLIGAKLIGSHGTEIDRRGAVITLMSACAIVSGLLFLAMSLLPKVVPGLDPEVIRMVENRNSTIWKPVAHIAFGSIVTFAIIPSMLLMLPLRMISLISFRQGFWVVGRRVEDRHYRWLSMSAALVVMSVLLPLVPGINLLVPALIANISAIMYRDIFSIQKKEP